MSLSSILRFPYVHVELDGQEVPYVLSFTASVGYDLNVAEATVSLPVVPSWANYWSVVGIRAGANRATAQTRFVGFLVETDYTLYPREVQLICRGPLVRAQLVQCSTAGGLDLSASGAGQTDQAIVQELLDQVGLTNPGPVALAIDGLGRTIGTVAAQYCRWTENQSALDMINQLDQICLGYRTFDTPAGGVTRAKVSTQPATTAALTFTEGVDIFSATPQVSILSTRNRVQVTGYDDGAGGGPFSYQLEQFNPLQISYVTDQISNNLIESATTGGTGISAQEVAEWWLGEVNRAIGKYQFVTPRDDQIGPGMTINITSPNRLGITQNFWVQHVDAGIDAKGAWSQTIIVIGGVLGVPGAGSGATLGTPSGGIIGTGSPGGPGGGTGTTGGGASSGTTPPGGTAPVADFTIDLQTEQVLIAGVATTLYDVQATSVSNGTSAALSASAWSCSAGSITSGAGDTFVTTAASITGSQTITLTVTDANGNTASMTKTITAPARSAVITRRLYLAGTDCIEAFDGTNWNTHSETHATVVANAPAWGDSGLGVGAVWTSDATLGTVTSTDPFALAPVSALWAETNINPRRILAGSGTGEIAVSNDGGATWIRAAQNVPGSISVLRCVISGTHPSQWFALTTAGLYRTDNAGAGWVAVVLAAAGETFVDFVLSFARDMVLMSGGRQMVDFAGNAQTLPGSFGTPVALCAHLRKDRFYVLSSTGKTAYHATDGATTLTAGHALPGGTAQARGLWRDGKIVDLMYIAAGSGGVYKSIDGLRTSGGYYALRTPGTGTAPSAAVYTQVGADGTLGQPTITPTVFVSAPGNEQCLFLADLTTEPAGWWLPPFVDSGWTTSVQSGGPGSWGPLTIAGTSATSTTNDDISQANGTYLLMRRSFTAPTGTPRAATLIIGPDSYLDAVWLNGQFLYGQLGVDNSDNPTYADLQQTIAVPIAVLQAGTNVLAIRTRNGYGGGSSNPVRCVYALELT